MPQTATSHVVPFRGRPASYEDSGEIILDREHGTEVACEVIQRRLFGTQLKFREVARRAGVCEQTVSNIAYGVVKSPRLSTTIKLAIALDLEIVIRRSHYRPSVVN